MAQSNIKDLKVEEYDEESPPAADHQVEEGNQKNIQKQTSHSGNIFGSMKRVFHKIYPAEKLVEHELEEALHAFVHTFKKASMVTTKPKEAIVVDKKWKSMLMQFTVFAVILGIFVASLAYFLSQKIQLLVTEGQLSQCSSYYEIESFKSTTQNSFLPMQLIDFADPSNPKTIQMFAAANWTSCNIDITEEGFAFKTNYTSKSYYMEFDPQSENYIDNFNATNIMEAKT